MTDIPDEAVQAALESGGYWNTSDMKTLNARRMRAALEAALPHLSPDPWAAQNQAMAERIKELEDGIREAVGRMWENRIGICYVEAGQRHALLSLLPDDDRYPRGD